MMTPDKEMPTLEENLKIIDSLKKELDGLRPLDAPQTQSLKTLFDIEFTYNSTAIEGNSFSYEETKIVLLDGITIGGKSVREHLEIINHKEAIDYIEELSRKKNTALTQTDISNIHALVLRGIDPKNAGRYRTVPVYVLLKNGIKRTFCDPLFIQDKMDAFFAWLFSEQKGYPLITASEAHTAFVSIHPFIDGNGRTARLLMNLILLQNGYAPVIVKNKDRAEYLDAIESWQNAGGKEKFYNLIIDYERESLEIYLKTVKEKILWK
jgi:Fic family protein